MDPVTAQMIGQGGSSTLSSAANIYMQSKTNQQNREMAREQMGFQERMSNTAYQRSTEDMRKAGLNPMLAYSQGGASSPSGASAVAQAPQLDGKMIDSVVNSALDRKKIDQTGEINKSVMDVNETQKVKNLADSNSASQMAKNYIANRKKLELETLFMEKNYPAIAAEAKYRESKANIDTDMVGIDAVIGRGAQIMNALSRPFNLLKSSAKPKQQPHTFKEYID